MSYKIVYTYNQQTFLQGYKLMQKTQGKFFVEFDSDEQGENNGVMVVHQETQLGNNQKSQTIDKFSGTMTKGFFKVEDDFDKEFITHSNRNNGESISKETNNSSVMRLQQKTRRRRTKKLQPLEPLAKLGNRPKVQQVQVYHQHNKSSNNQNQLIEESLQQRPKSDLNVFSRKMIDNEEIEQIQISSANILHADSNSKQQDEKTPNQIHSDISQEQQIVGTSIQKGQPTQEELNSQQPQRKEIQNYNIDPSNMRNALNKAIPNQKTIRFTVSRVKSILQIHTQYNLNSAIDNRYLMTATKVSNSLIATHHLSMSNTDMEQNGPSYLGKIKANFSGSVHNIFGPGLSPENYKQGGRNQRQILATVVYYNEMFSTGSKPRQFKVFMKRPEVNFFELVGVTPGKEESTLEDLYPQNKQKILVFRNRKPQWKQEIKGYSLNFRGRVSQPSIKNFILQEDVEGQGEQALLFGRISDDKFNMDVSGPMTVAVALGVVITSFSSA